VANPFPRLDVSEIIARRRFGKLQLGVVALCALAMFVVGYDTQVIGYTAPAIAHVLIVPVSALQPIFTWGGIGSLLGIVLIAPLADRSGRRRVIGAALLLIGLTTLLAGFAASVAQFKVLRLLTGLGVGAVMPVAMALVVEYMPRRHRIALATVVWIGYSLGAGFAGPIATSIGARNDWSVVLLFGGLLALLAAPLVWSRLPESPTLLLRRGHTAEVRAALIRISRRYDSLRATEYFTSEPVEPGLGVVRLFAGRRRMHFTGLLWGAFFANLMAVALVNAALSPLFTAAGLDEDRALALGLSAQLGGIVGGLAAATLADRYDRFAVLGGAFLLGALSVAAVAFTGSAPWLAVMVAMVAVFFTVGGQNAALAVTAASYPAAIGATAVALALGVGRIGQIAAPYVAAVSPAGHARFLVFAVPGLAAAAAALLITYTRADSRAEVTPRKDITAVPRAEATPRQDVTAVPRAEQSFRGVDDQRRSARRLEHLASLGLDLHGKRVLEVGAGVGDHTGFFLDRDCTIVSTESKPENCRLLAEMLGSYRSIGYA